MEAGRGRGRQLVMKDSEESEAEKKEEEKKGDDRCEEETMSMRDKEDWASRTRLVSK